MYNYCPRPDQWHLQHLYLITFAQSRFAHFLYVQVKVSSEFKAQTCKNQITVIFNQSYSGLIIWSDPVWSKVSIDQNRARRSSCLDEIWAALAWSSKLPLWSSHVSWIRVEASNFTNLTSLIIECFGQGISKHEFSRAVKWAWYVSKGLRVLVVASN